MWLMESHFASVRRMKSFFEKQKSENESAYIHSVDSTNEQLDCVLLTLLSAYSEVGQVIKIIDEDGVERNSVAYNPSNPENLLYPTDVYTRIILHQHKHIETKCVSQCLDYLVTRGYAKYVDNSHHLSPQAVSGYKITYEGRVFIENSSFVRQGKINRINYLLKIVHAILLVAGSIVAAIYTAAGYFDSRRRQLLLEERKSLEAAIIQKDELMNIYLQERRSQITKENELLELRDSIRLVKSQNLKLRGKN